MPINFVTTTPLSSIFIIDGKINKIGGMASNNSSQDGIGDRQIKADNINKQLR